jgi:hypothetical protein
MEKLERYQRHLAGMLEQFQEMTRNTVITDARGTERHIPCNMINCFCKYSDYEPLTLDEWIVCDNRRRAENIAARQVEKELLS